MLADTKPMLATPELQGVLLAALHAVSYRLTGVCTCCCPVPPAPHFWEFVNMM